MVSGAEGSEFSIEYVLLYNVGLNAFGRCAGDGVRFERREWGLVPQPLADAHCYHRYAIAPLAEGSPSVRGSSVARWSEAAGRVRARANRITRVAMRMAEAEVLPVTAGDRLIPSAVAAAELTESASTAAAATGTAARRLVEGL